MTRLGDIVPKVRSKNAGPFWLTVDIFCGSSDVYERVVGALATADVAAALNTPSQSIKRYDIKDLSVIKFSFPRPHVQGSIHDRDMHGAATAALFADLNI